MKKERPITTLFMISSLDGKISTGDTDKMDVDSDYRKIKGVKEGLQQYYDLEKITDAHFLITGKVMTKNCESLNINKKKPSQVPRPIARAEQTIPEEKPIYSFPPRDELYIPREETLGAYAKEKTSRERKKLRKIIWSAIFILLAALLGYGIFIAWKTYAVSKKMNTSGSKQTSLVQDVKSLITPASQKSADQLLSGAASGRINILLLGAAGEHKPGGDLTDTIMVMSIDVKNKKVALLSLPRDLYVQIPETQTFTKINSLYKISLDENKGADLTKEAVEKITNLKINYYLAVDFDAFEKIINNIGGVNVFSERDILDKTYPGPNYSYETFSLSKGQHLLDGATALQYVRERHDDPEGDFGRAKRQQQVIQAVKNKFFSAQTLFNVVAMSNVLDTLGDNVKTDMGFSDIEQFIALSKNVDTQNLSNVVVDAWKPDSLLKVSHVMVGDTAAFILLPRVGNYSEIQDLAQNIFNQSELKNRQEQIAQENASISIVNASSDKQLAAKIKKLLTEKLGMKNVQIDNIAKTETQDQTTVSNNDAKLYTIDELIKKLPATLTDQNADSSNDITITLGNDLVDVYKYEENTMQDLQNADDKQDNI